MRRIVCRILIAVLITLSPLAALAEAAEYAPLAVSDRGEAVTALQSRLIELGYLDGRADGIYGDKTRAAVAEFQSLHALPETGEADAVTQAALYGSAALPFDQVLVRDLALGDEGAAVTALQEKLIALGLLSGQADGQYGKKTAAAVALLERAIPGATADKALSVEELTAFNADDFVYYTGDYALGDVDASVRVATQRLAALNYIDTEPSDTLSGYIGNALKLFQHAAGLEVTGGIDRATMAALCASDAPAAAQPLRRSLKRGDTGKSVLEMEEKLAIWGFLDDAPNETFDRTTEAALTRFAAYCKGLGSAAPDCARYLTNPAMVSPTFQVRLRDARMPLYETDVAERDRGDAVRRVQSRLLTLYYLGKGDVDGYAGKNTVAAISAFQADHDLPVTGCADARTQSLLFSDAARTKPMPYLLKVSLDDQRVYAYARSFRGAYRQVREMVCSTGLGDTTPRGVFVHTQPQDRWHYFTKYVCWAQYTTILYGPGNILFHSVLYDSRNERTLRTSSLYNLGQKASHGCVRLTVEDAQWIFEHCPAGTPVVIY